MKDKPSLRRGSGWATSAATLLELVTICALTAVLATALMLAVAHATARSKGLKCLSNIRQIGTAMLLYNQEHRGLFPPTSHTAGRRHIDECWIAQLAPYLANVDAVRVCPADAPERIRHIVQYKTSSYALNNLVFDDETHNNVLNLPSPSKTLLLCILTANKKKPAVTDDHLHADGWTNWYAFLDDVEADRHRVGTRSGDRTGGSANYLFADGHVESLPARELKRRFDSGINFAAIAP